MEINRQGHGHYVNGINNQDFFYKEENLRMVLDGCSDAKYSEIGTRLFSQLFRLLPERLNIDKFEDNVKQVFDELLERFSFWYKTQEELEDFIMENLLFTIIACFETEEEFIVKIFGDCYIVTINQNDRVSYMKHYYGKLPPYFAYKYCADTPFKDSHFKTYIFSKKYFKKVGVASDGIAPLAIGSFKSNFDSLLVSKIPADYSIEGIILANRSFFDDDVTFLI